MALREHFPSLGARIHQSPMLRRHCYVCDFDTMIEIGKNPVLNRDVNLYDRAFVIDSYRVFTQQVLNSDHP